MKRISTAVVAAAIATGLALTPAGAQTAPATDPSVVAGASTTGTPDTDVKTETGTKPADGTKPEKPAKPAKKSGSSTGKLVAAATGIASALITTAIIVFSNPTGINKAVDLLNANFGLGLPHFALF